LHLVTQGMQFPSFFSGQRRHANSPPPFLLHVRSSKLFILTAVCFAVFTDVFLYAIIVPVVPFALSSRAGVAEKDIQSWVSVLLAVYGAALLIGSPVAGWYADQTSSRRLPLLVGLVALAGSTVMLCLARTVALFVLGRILQGLAAAVVWTVGTALLVDTVGQKEIGEVLGYVSVGMSVGVLIGPLLGGVVYDKVGYYPVFYMSFGLIALDIILRLALVEKKIAVQWTGEGSIEGEETATEGGIIVPLDGELHQTNPASTEQTATRREENGNANADEEKRVSMPNPTSTYQHVEVTPEMANPKIKWPPVFTLLTSRRLLTALWGCIVQASLMTAFDSVIPLFVREIFQWSSIGAGLVFLAVMVPSFASPVVGTLSDRYGARWFAVAGFIFAIPFWIMLRLVTHNSLNQKVLLCALLALIGVSLTLVMPPLMAEITYVVEAKEKEKPGRFGSNGAYAQAYGLFVAAFAAGTLIGPLWSGYIETAAGWGTMSWTLGLLSFAGAVPCLLWTGGLITDRNAKSGDERAIGRAALPLQNVRGSDSSV
jgi:MFS family permease